MNNLLFTIFLTVSIATVFNIILKRFGISHIIGYIFTGTIISYIFNFNGIDISSLQIVAEFGIVFLMFTIGLELNFDKIRKMKEILLLNGFLQVTLSASLIYIIAHYIFKLDSTISVLISLAFSLSSTAIVLTYLKQSKDIYTPYGEKSTAILIFQDLAVIPILILMSLLTNDTMSLASILTQTVLSAIFVVTFMFTIGKKIVNYLLKFSANTQIEELFLGSVFSIVIGSSLLAHQMGFTYSLGAFIAGMLIAETNFHVKVESDIATYKDLLLGTFFFSVGTKIDAVYFIEHIGLIFGIFIIVMLAKALVVYLIIQFRSDKSTSIKTALSLAQVGEFSFAIFALAASSSLIPQELASFLILITVLSMIITPFILNNIYKIAAIFVTEFYESDKITPIGKEGHIVIAGFSTLGRVVAQTLAEQGINFVIISDNLKHVLLARKLGYMAYFGHLDKRPVLESLNVDKASSVIITVSNIKTKRLICEAVLNFDEKANIILKIDSIDERKSLKDLNIKTFVDAYYEISNVLIKYATIPLKK